MNHIPLPNISPAVKINEMRIAIYFLWCKGKYLVIANLHYRYGILLENPHDLRQLVFSNGMLNGMRGHLSFPDERENFYQKFVLERFDVELHFFMPIFKNHSPGCGKLLIPGSNCMDDLQGFSAFSHAAPADDGFDLVSSDFASGLDGHARPSCM